jgi:lysozyme
LYTLGFDFSRHNLPIDPVKAYAAGVRFGAARFTIGDYYTDTGAIEAFDRCQDAGILMTAYHVSAPADGAGRRITSAAQIQRFLDAVGSRRLQLPPLLDNELSRGQSKAWISLVITGCFQALEGFQGHPYPYNYTNANFWNTYIIPRVHFANYPLWVANYTQAALPLLPRQFSRFAIWQYSADGNLLGAQYGAGSKSIDLNRWNLAYAPFPNGAPVPIPIPEPEPTVPTTPGVPQFIEVVNSTNLRSDPEINSANLLALLKRGTPLRVARDAGQWYEVKAYVWKKNTKPIP